jgi:hypothetical protein
LPRQYLFSTVGKEPDTKAFVAPESFLTTRFEFFRRAMNGSWKEAETHIVELPEDDPETFAVYINHVYTGQLFTATVTDKELATLGARDILKEVSKQYHTLFKVYVLAGKLQDVATKNTIMEAALAVSGLRIRLAGGQCHLGGQST